MGRRWREEVLGISLNLCRSQFSRFDLKLLLFRAANMPEGNTSVNSLVLIGLT